MATRDPSMSTEVLGLASIDLGMGIGVSSLTSRDLGLAFMNLDLAIEESDSILMDMSRVPMTWCESRVLANGHQRLGHRYERILLFD